jgi:hypothetical protein
VGSKRRLSAICQQSFDPPHAILGADQGCLSRR